MLRHFGQHEGGLLGYTRNVLREVVRLNSSHDFVFIYDNPGFIGTHGSRPNVREVAVSAPSRLVWDHLVVPYVARREGLDLIFNPKFSVPLLTRRPVVFVCHGLDWFVEPRWSPWPDRMSHRHLVPQYARRAKRIIAVSKSTREDVQHFLGVDGDKIHTVHLGIGESFLDPMPAETVSAIHRAYDLPERYFFFCGQIYPPKNFGRLVQAYSRVGPAVDTHLLVAGTHLNLSERELALVDTLGLKDWVRQVGWIEHDELPAFYQGAVALVMPSLYEGFPSPPLEAMACGCPVVTSNRHGNKEVARDAAILVDPEDVESIADGMRQILADEALRNELISAGCQRVRDFSWRKCARETLAVLESTLS